jgi:hypothetical protein
LLLNDDLLIRAETGENYIKNSKTGEWIHISEEADETSAIHLTLDKFPVKDSPTLQPVNISANTNKQFWVTVKVPDGTNAGTYNGKIQLKDSNGVIGEVQLTVGVLPINLSKSYLTYGVTYFSLLGDTPMISQSYKNEEQYTAEMKDMVAHGAVDSGIMQPLPFVGNNIDTKWERLSKVLTIRNSTGMNNKDLRFRGFHNLLWAQDYNGDGKYNEINNNETEVKTKVSNALAFMKPYGVEGLYFNAMDEPNAAELAAEKDVFGWIHAAGGKVGAAGGTDYENFFELANGTVDLYAWPYAPSSIEAAKWHSINRKITNYANPQTGVEKPETYRRNFGLLLWQSDFDGGATFAYQWKSGNIWNDFDHIMSYSAYGQSAYRGSVMAYPTMNGVIDTIEWEGYREAVDDTRYLTTLLDAIKSAKSDSAKAAKVKEAENYLYGVGGTASSPTAGALKLASLTDLSAIRAKIIELILSLTISSSSISSTPTPVPNASPTPVPTLTPTRVPTPTVTPVPTLTPTRVPTPTVTPVPTLTPTRTPTPLPTITPAPTAFVPTVTPVPPLTTITIQGKHVNAAGQALTTNIGQIVTLSNGSTNSTSLGSWSFSKIKPGVYTIMARSISGYKISSSSCSNCTVHTAYNTGSAVTVSLPKGGNYVDIYFKYTRYSWWQRIFGL